MAPRQKTFELVPNAPAGLQSHGVAQQHSVNSQTVFSKPPMTTKQAKKLHRQANKGPKLSKAEQRRIELMEQDRIRKEFEKEKAQARARTARERKKAKEDKEKDERKRKGLPLVEVHPSQGIISGFVRIGTKRGQLAINPLDAVKEQDTETGTGIEVESCTEAEDERGNVSEKENQEPVGDSGADRKPKRPRLSQPHGSAPEDPGLPALPQALGAAAKIAQELQAASYSRASSVDTDDPWNEALLENQIIADMVLASSRSGVTRSSPQESPAADSNNPSRPLPSVAVSAPSKQPRQPCPISREPSQPQPAKSPVRRVVPSPNVAAARQNIPNLGAGRFKKASPPYIPLARQTHAITASAARIQSAPPKFKKSAPPQNCPSVGPKFLPKRLQTPLRPSPNYDLPREAAADVLPSSTQAFLFDHADDFFPSPSQQAKELADSFTQAEDFSLSTYLSRPTEKRSSARPDMPLTGRAFGGSHARANVKPPPPRPSVSIERDLLDFPYLSTQAFEISSQDIREIDTPSRVRGAPQALHPPETQRKQALTEPTKQHQHEPATDVPLVRMNRDDPNCTTKTRVLNRHCFGTGAEATLASPGFRRPIELLGDQERKRPSETGRSSHTSQTRSSARARRTGHDDAPTQASRSPQSSHRRHPSATRATSHPNPKKSVAQVTRENTTARTSPPKRRMFGSSGPGGEMLVAMERSLQQDRREKRAREEELRAQERQMQADSHINEELDIDLIEIADEYLLDFDLGVSVQHAEGESTGHKEETGAGASRQAQPNPERAENRHDPRGDRHQVASQETDYGGIEDEVLDLIDDGAWLDDLDEGI